MTGRRPVNFAAGLYRKPEIVRPSKLGQRTSSGSAKFAALRPPVSLSVQRSTLPVAASTEYTSDGDRADDSDRPMSRPFSCQSSEPMTPTGRSTGRAPPLAASISRRRLIPSSLVTTAMVRPSGDTSKRSTSHRTLLVR